MTLLSKTFLLIYLITTITFAQNQTKVLFIGNSLTYSNNLPGMLVELASAEGKNLEVDTWTLAGVSLRAHANSSDIYTKINQKKWDYVILQSDDITAFDDMYNIEINCINKLLTGIRSNHSESKVIYQMVFGLENGVDIPNEGKYSYEEYMNKIYTGTLYIANQLNLQIAPVGWAWKTARAEKSDIVLFAADGAHPALRGSYIGACVFYSTIFGERLSENTYHSMLSAEEAYYLQNLASETVLNDLVIWNLVTDIVSQKTLPIKIFLHNNYPNPFNPTTVIRYGIPNRSADLQSDLNVTLCIYDILGNLVATLQDGPQSPGYYERTWNAVNISSGIYFYILDAGSFRGIKKMILLK